MGQAARAVVRGGATIGLAHGRGVAVPHEQPRGAVRPGRVDNWRAVLEVVLFHHGQRLDEGPRSGVVPDRRDNAAAGHTRCMVA